MKIICVLFVLTGIISGNARFTVLTDRMVRMEWADSAKFEDRASLAVVNRDLGKVSFKVKEKGNTIFIKTAAMEISYTGPERFNAENLSIKFDDKIWRPGDSDSGNLKGTIRTLDGCKGYKLLSKSDKQLENGIVSRDGWSLIDESGRALFQSVESDWKNIIIENPDQSRIDWYFMAYGHDYKRALSDYTRIAGKVPMPPKYTLGYWWSRYWAYTDKEILGIANELRSHDVPADVFVIDMGWHKYWRELFPNNEKDEFGQRGFWTGYTWERNLIANPEQLLGDLHKMGFKTSLNLHPASGIRPIEDCYEVFRKDYLSRTKDYDGPKDYIYGEGGYTFKGNKEPVGQEGKDAPVPFRLEQQAWADAYFGSVLGPIEKQGVDFWWMDWQQWVNSKYMPSVSNTFICNYMFWQDKARRTDNTRPLIYHRWGGLGSHRYQLGFSGDTYSSWDVLKFIPYFTATASNVCYGYWGHDIGGHMQLKENREKYTDPELYTRWLQSAVFTPIYKTHSTESKYLERKIWTYPSHFKYMRDAIALRYALTPYIYTAARQAYDTGICICRPMYYNYPEEDKAYNFKEQYMFGDDILATTICEPIDTVSGLAGREVWFPAGCQWYDMASHCVRNGGTVQKLQYAIDQNPWYPKAGSVIPLAHKGIQNLQSPTDALRLLVVPGLGKSECHLYEDDGISNNYDKEYAFTTIKKQDDGKSVSLEISPRKGSYDGALATRSIDIVLEGWTKAPSKVAINGKAVECESYKVEKAVSDKAIAIRLPQIKANAKTSIKIFQ